MRCFLMGRGFGIRRGSRGGWGGWLGGLCDVIRRGWEGGKEEGGREGSWRDGVAGRKEGGYEEGWGSGEWIFSFPLLCLLFGRLVG